MLRLTRDEVLTKALRDDPDGAALPADDRAMIDFALELTRPGPMRESDVEALRAHGFDDLMILTVVQTVAYFAFANRLVDGLGVPLEDHRGGG